MKMAQQQSMPNSNNGGDTKQRQVVNKEANNLIAKPIFHDFFGGPTINNNNNTTTKLNQNDSSLVVLCPNSPSASASDLASERRVGNHLEGVPFYGPRSDISGPEIVSNKIAGSNKRSNSDSTFPQIGSESLENSHLMKLLRSGSGGERLRRLSNDDEATFGSQQMKPSSASLIFQPPSGGFKLDRMIAMNAASSAAQYPPRGHFVPFVPHVTSSNRFRDANASPSNISQSAADEGSRTGIKGPSILSSLSAGASASERNATGSLPNSGGRQKGTTVNTEPESSTPQGSQHGYAGSRQMTIFYGGQAHVFDDVHPNKADVIMSLAGSNGGSWSTAFSPKSTAKLASESQLPSGESELPGNPNNAALLRDYRGRLCIPGSSSHGVGFTDRMPIQSGGISISHVAKEVRNSVQVAEPNSKQKIEQ